MDLLQTMRVFSRVAEASSFSRVARELGMTQPTVSKHISSLEERLGVRLISRTTRKLALTEDGRTFYEHCRHINEAVSEAEAAISRRRLTPAGLVRMAVPVAFGRLHVAPRIRRLLDCYPELKVDLIMNDGFVDLVEQGIDFAIRIGELQDPNLVVRRIGTTVRVTVGSPDYFARHGEPQSPHDLVRHNCIVYTPLATGNEWHFDGRDGPVRVRVQGNYRANNSEAVREGVIAGIGIAVSPIWLFRDEITNGLAKVVLRNYEPRRLPIHAVYPSRRFVPTNVRAVVDFLAEEFKTEPRILA